MEDSILQHRLFNSLLLHLVRIYMIATATVARRCDLPYHAFDDVYISGRKYTEVPFPIFRTGPGDEANFQDATTLIHG